MPQEVLIKNEKRRIKVRFKRSNESCYLLTIYSSHYFRLYIIKQIISDAKDEDQATWLGKTFTKLVMSLFFSILFIFFLIGNFTFITFEHLCC